MLGPFIVDKTAPFFASLQHTLAAKGISGLHLKITLWATGIATLVAFGLQYFGAGIVLFLLHKATVSALESKGENNGKTLIQDYFVTTGAMMATLWTASDSSLPIAFMFWAILVNLLGTISFKPTLIIIDSFEIACVVILLALAPTYTPAIAILFGATCLISLCASYLQSFRKSD